jgi:hypothetical protein
MVPKFLVEFFQTQLQVPPKTLQQEFLITWRWIQSEVWEKIWNPRNDITIKWEEQQGITEMNKKMPSKTNRLNQFGPKPLYAPNNIIKQNKCKTCQQNINNNHGGEHIHGGKYAQRQLALQIYQDHIEGRANSTNDYQLSKGATRLEDYIGEYIGDMHFEEQKKTKKQHKSNNTPERNSPRRPNRPKKQQNAQQDREKTLKRKHPKENEPPDPPNTTAEFLEDMRNYWKDC